MYFLHDTATTEIYTLSLHDALPIYEECDRCEEQWIDDLAEALEGRPGKHLQVVDPAQAEKPENSHSSVTSATYASSSVGSDRKSTRLNSSHSQIAYAVFCLKKKTIP